MSHSSFFIVTNFEIWVYKEIIIIIIIIFFFYKIVPDRFLRNFFLKSCPRSIFEFFFFFIKLSQTNPFHTISNKVSFGTKSYKYVIGYKNDDHKFKKISKISRYVKSFDDTKIYLF